jgi:serine/threonine-protein kinase
MIGTTVGPYVVERELGRGGMGVVYDARHVGLNQQVAIKVLLPEMSGDPSLLDRFFAEAQAAAASRHPGIVRILDVSRLHDVAYIVMEFLEGESLTTRLAREAPLPVADVLAITRQLASALSAAHTAGVVHRDLKPDNVYVVPDPDMPLGERTKILDFGIAKIASHLASRGRHTRTGTIMGTPTYMSPEQCSGAGAIDHRSDLYSLGCISFEMLTGQPPFSGEVGEVIGAHLYRPVPSIRALRPDVPRPVARLLSSLLAKAPAERPVSAAALVQSLDELTPRVITSSRPRPLVTGPRRTRTPHTTMTAASGETSGPVVARRRWPPIAAVAGLVVLAGVGLALTVPERSGGAKAGGAALKTKPPLVALPALPARAYAEAAAPTPEPPAPVAPAPAPVAPAPAPVAPAPEYEEAVTAKSDGAPDQSPERKPARPASAPRPRSPISPVVPPASGIDDAALEELVTQAETQGRTGRWVEAKATATLALHQDAGNVRAMTVVALAACNLEETHLAVAMIRRLPAERARKIRAISPRCIPTPKARAAVAPPVPASDRVDLPPAP